jgi:outer membrane protein assembly factor BamD (BamD/ComL family)
MSIAGIASSSIFQLLSSQSTQSPHQKFKQEFQQLGQDLQSGNLAQAQTDFAALQPSSGQSTATSGTQTSASPIATAFQQLSQDLQSGNLTAAQQDYSAIQQDFQQQAAGGASGHAHHHHHHSGGSQDSSSTQNTLNQLFSQLGQALQSGNLSTAQSAYASLQQDLTQLSGATGSSSSGSSNLTSASNPLSVSV